LEEDLSNESQMIGDIRFKNIYFNYPSRQNVSVLNNLNLIAHVGQTTALVGSTGSGLILFKIFLFIHKNSFSRKKYNNITFPWLLSNLIWSNND
jgi:ABC-type transport system involved in Fe-S cluster assembly fused permease/ATPase subunit